MPHNHRWYGCGTLAALLCAAGLPIAQAQAPPGPGKIAHITVAGNAHVPTADIVTRVTQEVSAATGKVDASTASAALKEMGLFQSYRTAATPAPAGGMDYTCTVVENPVVRAIRFSANTPDGKPTFPAATLTGRMQIAVGQVLNTNTLSSDLGSLFNHDTGYIRAQGYFCEVSSDINIDPRNGVLTIPLVEYFVDKIEIRGEGPVPADDLRAALGVKPGDLFDTSAVIRGLRRVQDLHRFAEIEPFQFTPGQPGKGTLVVTVRTPHGPSGTLTAGTVPPITVAYGGVVGGPIVVPVRLNDHATGHFLVLTNSDLSQVSSAFAASLSLTPEPMMEGGKPYFVNGQPAASVPLDRMTLGEAPGVEFRGVSLPAVDLTALSKQVGQPIDGILGADLLSRVAAGIDGPRRQVTFWNHGNLTAAERIKAGYGAAAEVPAGPFYGTFPILAVAAKIRNGAQTEATPVIIATGSQTSLLPTVTAAALGMTALPNPDDPKMLLSRAAHLDLPGLSFNAPLFQLSVGDNNTTLGMNVLSQYRVLLDGPARAAYFAPEVTVTGGDPRRASLAVPFQFDHLTVPYPIVQVSINGRPPLPFLFDTGTYCALTVDQWAAEALGLKVDGQSSGTINGSVPAQTAPVSMAVLQGRTPADSVMLSLEQAVVTDLSVFRDAIVGQRIAGIIGAGMLRDTAVHFDFPSRTLTFFPEGADVPTSPGTVMLPLSERASEENYFATFTSAAGSPVRMLVDTGSAGTELPYEMRATLRPVRSALGGHSMLGSMALGQNLLLRRLPLAGMPAGELIVSAFPTADDPSHWHPATLGMDILSRLAVTLDIPHMRLLLGPPPENMPEVYHGWVGVRLAQKGSQFRITQALPASPAAKAGLKAGDELLAVDGRPFRGLTLSNVRTLADGLAGTPAAFQIRRAGTTPRTVRFRRASTSGDPPCPLNGVFGLREAANPFVIKAVLPDCPADKAGITAGDTITVINGHPTPTLSPEQWQTLLLLTRLTLTVDRAGMSRTVVLVSAPAERTPSPNHTSVQTEGHFHDKW